MSQVIIQQETQTPVWRFGGDVAYLRIMASYPFYANPEGIEITGPPFYQQYTCQIVNGYVVIPEVSLYTTTDSSIPTATYTATFYDSAGTKRNTKLSQFWIDPYFLNPPTTQGATVSGGGAEDAMGVYVYHGQYNGKGYYNLTSFANSTSLAAIRWTVGNQWEITDETGTTLYSSLNDVDFPWEVTLWSSEDIENLPVPAVEQNATVITATWEELTLTNQGSTPFAQPLNSYWTIPQVKQYIESMIGDGTTPFAARLRVGKTALTRDPDVSSYPIAVAENDYVWEGINESVYLSRYGFSQSAFNDALAAIGSVTPTELVITSAVSLTSNTVIPSNVLVTFEGNGSFSVQGGRTITIGKMAFAPARQIFSGAGDVVFAKDATGGQFQLEWWLTAAATATHAFDQAVLSLTANSGGTLNIGPGVFKTSTITLPNRTIVQGAGSGVDNAQGTTITPLAATDTNDPIFLASEAFRNITIKDLTLSVEARTSPSCFTAQGTAPNSAFGLVFDNVTFHGTGSTSAAQTWIKDLGGAWECVGVEFKKCMWITPASTRSFRCDSINTLATFDTPVYLGGAGYTANYIAALGFGTWINPDFRGPSGTPVPVKYKEQDAVLTATTGVLTLDSGEFDLNDIGSQIAWSGGTANITGLTAAGVASTDYVTAVTVDTEFEFSHYTPNTSKAYACFHVVGDHATLNISLGGADEGFQYFLVNDAPTNVSPINVFGGFIQSIVQFNDPCVMNLYGTKLNSQTFNDTSGVIASLFTHGCSLDTTSIYGVGLTAPKIFGIQNGNSAVYTDLNFHEGQRQQALRVRTDFLQGNDSPDWDTTNGFVSIMSAAVTPYPLASKPLLRLGRLNNVTNKPDFWYDITRNYDEPVYAGHLQFTGNQNIIVRGYDFDANVKAVTFVGDTYSPAQITSSLNTEYIPPDPANKALQLRLSTNANLYISGLLYSTDPVHGEYHEIVNVGSFILTLRNNTGAGAVNRFLTDTGANMPISPNERVTLRYDGTTQRWRCSKGNVTGLNGTGSAVTTSLPTIVDNTLNVTGATTLDTTLVVGGGEDFSVEFVPSSGLVGTAMIGGADNHIALDEGGGISTGTLELKSDSITLDGPTGCALLQSSDSIKSVSPTAGIGYGTGAGGAQTQITSKATTVVSNTITTAITMNNAALNLDTAVSFTFTNSSIAATDQVIVTHQSAGTSGAYVCNAFPGAGSAVITVRNVSAGNLSEAIVLRVSVYKAVSS